MMVTRYANKMLHELNYDKLPMKMTVAELKTKIHTEFEIPTNVQRWIIGKNLADHDETTLEELHAVDGSSVFLYLVAPGNLIHSALILFRLNKRSIFHSKEI